MTEQEAAARFWYLQVIRLVGLLATIGGAMMAAGRLSGGDAFGGAFMLGGILVFFFLPRWLARQWKDDER